MGVRCFVDVALAEAGQTFDLPDGAARHVQVLRAQPGECVTLFDGRSDVEWDAEITAMGRKQVGVRLLAARAVQAELPHAVTLAVVMPANDRMDFLVEKATELGAVALQPLMSERSVLRLHGERAEKKRAHWQGVAVAAAEQCGRVRVPEVRPVLSLSAFLAQPPAGLRWMGSPGAARTPLPAAGTLTWLSGPEGGLSEAEQLAAQAAGFLPVGLGLRVLRADTAPLAVLAWLSLA
ncbi:MAG: 16S rRNA (uracil(1498)-N(3))-methyltransferase [Burkholderiales bacterium]|uniref:16S rRNA (uracil(1498)-N(3))-methyltransferase n=1 Tax=Inhella sp. TaxID=1921806 RepID=UPI001ACB0AEB|nr:16S rRNA (uracil(1498)-N(3))-methyltransferase [Burkholderiales bacterium]